MNRPTLSLRTEALHELGSDELRDVAGAAITHGCTIYPTLADVDGCIPVIPTFHTRCA